ncbi:uncharacterized protein LOC100820963 isoform X5 [Brachypodium distachyon]|uniref:Uncharacterized protein n=1 Tax=Brachypodium distachyon TaxID=15368 RepID=A0A0Q3H1R6_BRADI|nr:uncharacterized protein LOC100820963 isoform X5 [Brachypodium distachyon]KQK16877.1 hypothetical protein BRADI_1g31193v3 [Brachypodium distachyon]KQK16879.1 hypothetical protein BRADI_1g31193v3 [Brachypodium distachyon]|eukprot:XP_010240076.1 uncharacterized protein LOC100820963 isoform X5 [Brachypodium distachyon]
MAVPAGSLKFPPAMTENAAAEENKEKVEAGPNNPAGSLGFSPVMRGKGAGAKEEKRKDKDDDEEELVVTNPVRASLIYHSFNIAFVLEVIFFIAHIVIYHNARMFSLRHMPWHLVASIHSVGDELLFAEKV